MIGRGRLRPWLFRQIAEGLAGRPIPDPTPKEQHALRYHFDLY